MEMKFNLLKDDMGIIENFEEIEELKARTFKSAVKDLNLFTVQTSNIEAIISREELFSIIFLSKKNDLANYNIISITEPFQRKQNRSIDINCNDLLQLEFTDIRKQVSLDFLEEHKDNLLPISDFQIEAIKSFIIKNKDNPFIINCDAGISRSSAIGMLVEKLIGNDTDINKIQDFHRYSPNQIMLEKFDV